MHFIAGVWRGGASDPMPTPCDQACALLKVGDRIWIRKSLVPALAFPNIPGGRRTLTKLRKYRRQCIDRRLVKTGGHKVQYDSRPLNVAPAIPAEFVRQQFRSASYVVESASERLACRVLGPSVIVATYPIDGRSHHPHKPRGRLRASDGLGCAVKGIGVGH